VLLLAFHRPSTRVSSFNPVHYILLSLSLFTQLIDPYWTFIPALIRTYYLYHQKAAGAGGLRATVAGSLLMLWAARLTHSYFRRWAGVANRVPGVHALGPMLMFTQSDVLQWGQTSVSWRRAAYMGLEQNVLLGIQLPADNKSAHAHGTHTRREEWQFGAREDWRYSDLSRKFPSTWWLLSFLATYLVQHAMLFGITLPLWAVATSTAPWTGLDGLATLVTIAGACGQTVVGLSSRSVLRSEMCYQHHALVAHGGSACHLNVALSCMHSQAGTVGVYASPDGVSQVAHIAVCAGSPAKSPSPLKQYIAEVLRW
jgi:hypothetical protein